MTDRDNSILGMIDDLGARLNAPKAERPQTIDLPFNRLRRADVWPPEVLEEIRRIYSGEME